MLTSKIVRQWSFSFSLEKFKPGCLDDKWFLNLSVWSGEENSKNDHQKCHQYSVSRAQVWNH